MSYSFPLLTGIDILECLSQMKISISKENLTEPSCEWVKSALENFIEFFTGKNIEYICSPKFNALNNFLHPELHEESIGFIVRHRFFQELSSSSGYHEFSLRDYFFPTFPKVRKIFSAIINFAKFREEFVIFLKNFSRYFSKTFSLNIENFIKISILEGKIKFLQEKSFYKKFSYRKFEKIIHFLKFLIFMEIQQIKNVQKKKKKKKKKNIF